MIERHLRVARALLSLPTAPFGEQAVIEWVKAFAARRPALSLRADRWGNLLIGYRGRKPRRPLIFCAHLDHPGFMALEMTGPRSLEARWMGGVPEHLFPGAKVRFFSDGKWVKGVVRSTAPAHDAARVATITVSGAVAPGAAGMWDFPDPRVAGTRLHARGCDDVAGAASLICLLDDACRRKEKRAFHVFLTRAEEPGFLGAIGACRTRTLPKDAVIVAVETSKELPGARQGDGPIVRVGDRTAIFSPTVSDYLSAVARDLAKREPRFRAQRKLMDGGTCESAVYVAYGYEAGGLCLALGNYHNIAAGGRALKAEYIDTRDFDNLVRLYRATVEAFDRYGRTAAGFRQSIEKRFAQNRGLFEDGNDG